MTTSTAVAEAIRVEIRHVLDEGPFTIQVASRVERIAMAARSILGAVGNVPEAIARIKDDQADDANPIANSSAAETFGARLIQEIVAVLPAVLGRKQEQSPEALTQALVVARSYGMTDVAAELEKKLVGRVLDGERPIVATVDAVMAEAEAALVAAAVPDNGALSLSPQPVQP